MNNNLNRTALAIAIGGILSASANASINNIIISEYVEGTSNNKAIELTNTGSEAYTFTDNIELQYSSYDNRVQDKDGNNILQGVTIEAGATAVIYNGGAEDTLLDLVDDLANAVRTGDWDEQSYNSLNFNGDDHVALVDTSSDTVLDIIGNFGAYGNFWGADTTFRRRLGEGDTTPVQSSSYDDNQWEAFAVDTFDGLGDASYSPYQEEVIAPAVCVLDEQTAISTIQGSGSTSPLIESGYESSAAYDVIGIVTAVTSYPEKGFYMQDVTPDGDETTSDGIFVSTSNASDELIGQTVCVNSTVVESYSLTQLEADSWDILDVDNDMPVATDIEMIAADNGSFNALLERHEGMLINLHGNDIDPSAVTDEEGNLSYPVDDMRVTQTFGFNYDTYRNSMTLAYQRPNVNPTQNNVAGSDAAIAAAAENDDYRLIIESSEKAANGEIPYYPAFNSSPATNYIRINDSVIDMQGVVTYSYGNFNLVVTNELTNSNFVHNSDRTSSPELDTTTADDSFAIKVGTQNLLNLFNSPFGGDSNTHGENRGADDENEYQKQLAKIVSAIVGLDADIVGLMEIENNGFGTNGAVQALVDAINAEYWDEDPKDADTANSINNRYVFVGYDENGDMVLDAEDAIGSDAIATGIIYRPTKVTIDSMQVISMPEQHAPTVVNDNNEVVKDSSGAVLESGDNYQRETMAATFKVNNTGKTLTIAVNHFKSKGSTCWEEWDGVEFGSESTWSDDAPDEDLQGSCENLRVAAAVQLGEELEYIGGDRIIVGDLNAYGQEDPLLVLTENSTGKTLMTARDTFIGDKPQFTANGAAQEVTKSYGYLNAVALKDEAAGELSWSYSYNDEIGSLDHLLISPSLETRLIDATDWHINAAESSLYDYNDEHKGDDTENFYVDDAYRSSDHDSAIISLSYQYAEVDNGKPVALTISSGLLTIPYVLSSNSEETETANLLATTTLAGDVAQIALSSTEDMSDIVLPSVTLTEDGQSLVEMELNNLDTGHYTATLTLTRNAEVLTEFTNVMEFEALKQDSTTAEVAPVEEYDGSGGSFGIFGLLSLLGLGFLRHNRAK